MSTDDDMLQADLRARREALDVSRSFIVQAPAGSGKTELLIQRYLCLLATVEEPEEVIAITFTRKAANEMQARVIDALRRARQGATARAEHEQRTLRAASRILARDEERGWHLSDSPRRMRIMTLDAFCASITRMLPASSGLGGSLTTAADQGMRRLYLDAATATLDWLPGSEPAAAAIRRVLEHLDNSVGAYIEYVAAMLARRDQWLEIVGSGDVGHPERVRAALEANIAHQVRAQLRLVRARFEAIGGVAERRLLRYAGEQLQARRDTTELLCALRDSAWPRAEPADVALWRAIAAMLLKADGDIRSSVNVNNGFPPGDDGQKAAFTEWLGRLQDEPGLADLLNTVQVLPDAAYRDEQWQVLLALFAVLPLAVAELRRLFAENGTTDHVEVAQAAGAALGSPGEPGELAMLLDYRVQHLLIDEMQDTATGQYRLVGQLTAGWEPGDGRTLFCVGDPMQSIYRFRDAEVGQFVAARHNGIGERTLEPLVLRQNFRSGERLVSWFNSTFSRILPAMDDVATGAISHAPSRPVAARAGTGRVAVHALVDASPEDEAGCSADAIEACLAEDESSRVAVLVRSRTQLPQLLAQLRRRGVSCQAIEIDRLTDLPEIIDLLTLTRALCHDGDRIAWLGLLRSPWTGMRWADVHALVRNDRASTVRELAADRERLGALGTDGRARLQRLFRVLDEAAPPHGSRTLRERVERAWMSLGGPGCMTDDGELDNAYRFLDVLERLEFAGTLPDVAQLEQQLDEERVSSPADERTRVQVMTMHKAKGLEFEHVVLHGLGRTTGSGSRDVLAWLTITGDDGSSSLIISPLGPRATLERDPLHRFIERSARESDRLELDRLLYVACTRAASSLHLVGSVASRRNGRELGRPPADSLLARLWTVVESEFEEAFAGLRGAGNDDGGDDADPVQIDPVMRRMREAWQTPPLPPLPPTRRQRDPAPERQVDYHWVGSNARHAGTLVHRWLQKIADGDVALDLPRDELLAVSTRWAAGLGVEQNDVPEITRRVADALAAVAGDATGRWLLNGEGAAELRVSGLLEGRRNNVIIDRVRIDAGEHWLIDYKTGTHEGSDLEGFIAQEVDRYRTQLAHYLALYRHLTDAPVRTALYFPLLGRFVEVDVAMAQEEPRPDH